ncbi:glycosyltransferase [Methylomonas sp. MgM2]
MHLSVIICTYNRSYNLVECLTFLENQEIDDNLDWEINVVDNNSSDETKSVIENYAKSSRLNIHYIFEEKQGLSFARNTGIKNSKGQYLLFIDDDIRVTPNWLQSIYTTFEDKNCDAVGGRIHLESPERLPKWITPDLYGFLGHQDFGPIPCAIDGIDKSPFGGNMAIRRQVIDLIGDFNVNLGRKGEGLKKDELFKGEETDFFYRLVQAHGALYYNPDALVFHKLLPHQLRKTFFLTLHHNAGIQRATSDDSFYKRQVFGIPFFVVPQLIRAIYRYIYLTIYNGFDNSFRQLMNVYYFLGMIEGYFKNRHQTHSTLKVVK